jgi:hypothetical protein
LIGSLSRRNFRKITTSSLQKDDPLVVNNKVLIHDMKVKRTIEEKTNLFAGGT